jgi:hypothetical protein
VAEQIRATPGWVQHYQQMSPGHFAGLVRYLDLQGVEIYEEHMNTRVEQNFSAPQGSLAFCFDRSDNALYVLNGESRNIWITPRTTRKSPWCSGRSSCSATRWMWPGSKGCSWPRSIAAECAVQSLAQRHPDALVADLRSAEPRGADPAVA